MGSRQKKNAEDIESVYEKRADRIAARAVDGNSVVMSVDPVDALPVKSLAGELHYRSTAMSKALGMHLHMCIRGSDTIEQELSRRPESGI
jgi:hypothetical protein